MLEEGRSKEAKREKDESSSQASSIEQSNKPRRFCTLWIAGEETSIIFLFLSLGVWAFSFSASSFLFSFWKSKLETFFLHFSLPFCR